jgi:hypothetical protein
MLFSSIKKQNSDKKRFQKRLLSIDIYMDNSFLVAGFHMTLSVGPTSDR